MAIKRHALDYEESRAWVSVVPDAFREFFNCAQEENEALSDCTRCFKVAREVLQSHLGGPIVATKAMEGTRLENTQMETNDEAAWVCCSL